MIFQIKFFPSSLHGLPGHMAYWKIFHIDERHINIPKNFGVS